MKLTDRDKKLLWFLLACVLLFVPYFFVLRPAGEENERLKLEVRRAKERNSYLISQSSQESFYLDEAQRLEAEKAELLARLPEELTQESLLLFLSDVENRIPVSLYQVVFGNELPFAVSKDQQTQPAAQSASAEAAEAVDAQAAEAAEAAGMADAGGTAAGGMAQGAVEEQGMTAFYTSNEFNFSASYEGFKEFLSYINSYRHRMVITRLDLTFVEAGDSIEGAFTLLQYGAKLPDREAEEERMPQIALGTTNIFRQAAGIGGMEAEQEEDFFLLLSQPGAETGVKVFGRSRDVDGESYLSSDSNDEQEITITFSGSGGSYTAECSIGKSKYEQPLAFNKDGGVYLDILSSPRASEQDKVSAQIHLYNNMDVTLHVAVTGDDTEAPRVNIRTKEGAILMQ